MLEVEGNIITVHFGNEYTSIKAEIISYYGNDYLFDDVLLYNQPIQLW